ncbi:RpiR family transcriptional regulator [Sinobaca qinghaiensis]|uniref:RpiR family transcriptional regulator n=1 Tax=Sinobaca qinghaiensis TaxID=342944 RepID=A0A419V7G5_9BACL|nr:SIS domain-containing protein [Sinobaca qinghaiensis]RKD75980.1 RpiR family transcriptional regulator [Sinobaca qinghaiensis]
MLNLRTDHLTPLEKALHHTLTQSLEQNDKLKIIDAAELGGVSPSKVSKLVRKLGFAGFKQYKLYFSGYEEHHPAADREGSSEIQRLLQFLESYDPAVVDEFLSVFTHFKKIILFGLGPSYISTEYFAYKLAAVTDRNIFVTHDENYAERLADNETLLIVFSVTGKFASFEHLFHVIKKRDARTMLVLEEPMNTRDSQADYIFHLSPLQQNNKLLAFEKTRTIFFIFMEEVITKLKQEREKRP